MRPTSSARSPPGTRLPHDSLVLQGGDMPVSTLQELVARPRANDVLYIPALHYMNIVNPSMGVITASSRFGALLLKRDGTVVVPYNVRLTQSLLDIFGDGLAWLSQAQVAANTSKSYGARNPTGDHRAQRCCRWTGWRSRIPIRLTSVGAR